VACDAIPDQVTDDANLVKNTTQRIVAKAFGAIENYFDYDDIGQPSHTKDGRTHFVQTTRKGTTCRSPTTATWRSPSARNRTTTSKE